MHRSPTYSALLFQPHDEPNIGHVGTVLHQRMSDEDLVVAHTPLLKYEAAMVPSVVVTCTINSEIHKDGDLKQILATGMAGR